MKTWKRVLVYSVPATLFLSAAPAIFVAKGDPAVIAGGMLGVFILTTVIGMLFIGAEALIDRYAPQWLKRILYAKVLPGIPNVGPAAADASILETRADRARLPRRKLESRQ